MMDPNKVVLIKRILTGVLVIAVFALTVTAIWYGTRVKSLTIDTVEVSGGETIKHSEIEKMTWQKLEGTYFGIIPLKFAWFYPEEKIHESIESIERIHNVSVTRKSSTALLVSFDEYTPKALWCDTIESDQCLFLDNSGYAFAPAPKLSGGSFLRFLQVGQSAKIHESFTSVESFEKLFLLTKLLSGREWFVSHIELDQVGDAFLHLVDGAELKVTLKQTPAEVMDNLQVVLSSEKFSHLAPDNFKYIDLRFGNKVFVNEELDIPEITDVEDETGSTSVSEEID